MTRGAPARKFPSLRLDNRTGLIEAGYRPDTASSSITSDDRRFLELDKEYYKKQSKSLFFTLIMGKLMGKVIIFFQHQNAGIFRK